jgi:hypothetical protein
MITFQLRLTNKKKEQRAFDLEATRINGNRVRLKLLNEGYTLLDGNARIVSDGAAVRVIGGEQVNGALEVPLKATEMRNICIVPNRPFSKKERFFGLIIGHTIE